jgi:hypothetical protein
MAKKSDEIKPTDGRKYNKRLPKKVKIKGQATSVPAKMNTAKKNRIKDYSVRAIKKVFGSEQEALEVLAEQSKDSFQHMKLLLEYAYGKAGDNTEENRKVSNAPVINFFGELPKAEEQTIIDVESEEVDESSEDKSES